MTASMKSSTSGLASLGMGAPGLIFFENEAWFTQTRSSQISRGENFDLEARMFFPPLLIHSYLIGAQFFPRFLTYDLSSGIARKLPELSW